MIKTRSDLHYYLERDKKMNKIVGGKIKLFLKNMLFPNTISNFLRLLRYTEYYTNSERVSSKLAKLVYAYRLRSVSTTLGFSIPINTCGAGLSIPHKGTIIINSSAVIGENCRIHGCVNIGANLGGGKSPQIGNNVYIGPSAVLIGEISIADNVIIGANATVTKSCEEEYAVLVGSPAKVIKRTSGNWFDYKK